MPLNCSIFVTQKEKLKCQAARGKSKANESIKTHIIIHFFMCDYVFL